MHRQYLQKLDIDVLNAYPRYFKAILRRLEKLESNLLADRKKMIEINKYRDKYLNMVSVGSNKKNELKQLRWMIEEYRVSLWAQDLKTPYPISAKRIEAQIKICI